MGCCASTMDPPPVPETNVLNFRKSKNNISEFKSSQGEGKLTFKYVIIGAGTAAGYAAKAFVESGKLAAGELCIIGLESLIPYERPALTKGFMTGKADLPKFNTCQALGSRHEQDWYDKNGISLLLETMVESVDLKNQVIQTATGEIIYRKCLAATGSSPIYLSNKDESGGYLSSIYYIHSYDEAWSLRTRLQEAKSEEKVVIVGGGYIGTEMAACISHYEFRNVTIVVSGEHVIKRIFPPTFAKIYEDAIVNNGMKLLKGHRVVGFGGRCGHVSTVILNNGERLQADIVIVGVGSRPNTRLFKGQVEMEMKGIKVDGQMKSSVDGFYACGDIATFPIKCQGDMRRMEHVSSARKTAMQAARAMLGIQQDDIDLVPFFFSEIFDLSWEMYGKKSEKSVLFGFDTANPVGEQFGCLWLGIENRVVGVFVKGASKKQRKKLENLVREHVVVSANLLQKGSSDELKAFVLGKTKWLFHIKKMHDVIHFLSYSSYQRAP